MKRAFFCISFLVHLTAGSLSSQGVRFAFVETRQSWDSTQKVSLETGKPIFVAVHTDWCKYCKLMEQEVYRDEQVSDYFNRFFINVMMDGEKDFGQTFAGLYGVKGFPTLFFMNGSGVVLQRVNGYTEADQMLGYAHKALQKSDLIPLIEARYVAGNVTAPEMLVYLDFIGTTDLEQAVFVANDYLESLDSLQFADSAVFAVIRKFALDPGRRVPLQVLRMKEKITGNVGREAFGDYFATLYTYHLDRAISMESDSLVRLMVPHIMVHFPEEEHRVTILGTWKIYYAETENAAGYEQAILDALQYAGDQAEFLYQEAYEIAMDYPDYFGFPSLADRLMDRYAMLKGDDFDGSYLHAYINTLSGNTGLAGQYARTSRKLAATKKQQELADQLLQYIENMRMNIPVEEPSDR